MDKETWLVCDLDWDFTAQLVHQVMSVSDVSDGLKKSFRHQRKERN